LRRVDAFPRGLHQLVVRQARRQRGAARIPEALLGPVTPRRSTERGGADAEGS